MKLHRELKCILHRNSAKLNFNAMVIDYLMCVKIGSLEECAAKYRNSWGKLNLKIVASLFHVCADQ
jgi:hypothetical protein